ncbi:hypothetical protein [Dactylosporangium sp. NPDC049140]|jgi:hypothetical protein|uniref:hypothetical protein n=1 Tax=Dactylosporangium sp. NPDC049140 TaxID=3155647 RepID=UPI0033CF1021
MRKLLGTLAALTLIGGVGAAHLPQSGATRPAVEPPATIADPPDWYHDAGEQRPGQYPSPSPSSPGRPTR